MKSARQYYHQTFQSPSDIQRIWICQIITPCPHTNIVYNFMTNMNVYIMHHCDHRKRLMHTIYITHLSYVRI